MSTFNKIRRRVAFTLLLVSMCLCAFLSVCYIFHFDFCAAITAFPVWSWLAFGLPLTALGSIGTKKYYFIAAFSIWLVYLFFLADETNSMIRACFKSSPPLGLKDVPHDNHNFRVISLNCGGGNPDAAKEVAIFKADIIILQETPTEKDIKQLTNQLFDSKGAFLLLYDNAVIVNGEIISKNSDDNSGKYSTLAHVKLKSGIELVAISLRFVPPTLRFDIWSPDCWKDYASDRCAKRLRVSNIAEILNSLPPETPILIGGDFNMPARDGALNILNPLLRDSFIEAGIGWGNTVLNDLPVHRFDQIWISKHFKAIAVIARKTQYSDHRMAIADLVVNTNADQF